MTTIGYIRVSKDDQDLDKQQHLLLEYSQQQKVLIDEFIDIEISSRKNQAERRITHGRPPVHTSSPTTGGKQKSTAERPA